ncbi:MAG: hypothetical protein SNJ59_08900 [Aggregatilineales bacterium]
MLFSVLLSLISAGLVHAQTGGYTPYAWEAADLALLVPFGWRAEERLDEDAPFLVLSAPDGRTSIGLRVLPNVRTLSELRPGLEALLLEQGQVTYFYRETRWFGQPALMLEGASRDGALEGMARAGRLPDLRALLIAGVGPRDNTLARAFNRVADSIAFSAISPPTMPTYAQLWRVELPPAPENLLTLTDAALAIAPRVSGLLHDGRAWLYAVEALRGVVRLNPTNGVVAAVFPFDDPAQPSGIAIDEQGTLYIADALCRCLRLLRADGTWLDAAASFGGGAPFHLAAADGILYAIDSAAGRFVLRAFDPGRGFTRDRMTMLNFNAVAPPLVVARSGQVEIIEWLRSLLDGETHGAVSLLGDDDLALYFWLDLPPERVRDAALDPDGQLVLATSTGSVWLAREDGALELLLQSEAPLRALVFDDDGILYLADDEGHIAAYDPNQPPERIGSPTLIDGVPVQGMLNAQIERQLWTFSTQPGEIITIAAIDTARTNQLDVALRLLAPDGGERAYNDDQLGPDLPGWYDAQIRDYVVRDVGEHTIVVERVRGEGTYTLGVMVDRVFTLTADAPAVLEGAIQDVFPYQRWAFEGRAGQLITFTMFAESGTLDPALELLRPDGRTLAYNDDALDPQLGINAQLVRIELPEDGRYVIEPSRYEGIGRYRLVVVLNN